jgi:hypothetical protein
VRPPSPTHPSPSLPLPSVWFETPCAGAKENKRNKLENEKRKEIQSFRQDPQVRTLAPPFPLCPSACINCISQVLLAKIEALESGKEGSGYEVQKKIEE